MWIKLCLLLVYICLLFLLSRLLETFSWCDLGSSGVLSRQLLDPMRLSVAKLKCLLDQRGVSYDGVVEKSELTRLVEVSGPLRPEDIDITCDEESSLTETNFTSGAHFIEEVEDAKDSVWLVQVVTHTDQVKLVMNQRWRNIQRKASHVGVRIGVLDCSLDVRYCRHKGWKVPVLLLALPSLFEKKANVVMYNYSGPATESAVMDWIREKLDSRIKRFKDLSVFQKKSSFESLQPELETVFFTHAPSAPLFFSALSVKFPGRVHFGLMSMDDQGLKKTVLKKVSEKHISHLPACVIYTTERNYTYGFKPGERFSFSNMEIFFKFLYPCLNDIFIISFCVANVISWFELFVSNCGLFKRLRKFIWCVLKYNLMVIMLWLPVIGLFQMPYLDRVPLMLLKLNRLFTTSDVGSILRGDYVFFVKNPIYVYLSFVVYLVLVTLLCRKYRDVEDDTDDWFNLGHMQTLTHLRANSLFDPMRTGSYDLVGGFEVFRSRFSQHSLWLQPSIPLEYIQHLPTWRFTPQSLARRAAENANKIKSALQNTPEQQSPLPKESKFESERDLSGCSCASLQNSLSGPLSQNVLSYAEAACHSPEQNLPMSSNEHCSQCLERQTHPQMQSLAVCDNCAQSRVAFLDSSSKGNSDTSCKEAVPGIPVTNHDASNTPFIDNTSQSAQMLSTPEDSPESSPVGSRLQPDVLPNGFRKGYMESLQCVICLDDYVPLTMLCGLPCGHVFHETCIISWLNREKHFCPMCRWPSYQLMTSQNSP